MSGPPLIGFAELLAQVPLGKTALRAILAQLGFRRSATCGKLVFTPEQVALIKRAIALRCDNPAMLDEIDRRRVARENAERIARAAGGSVVYFLAAGTEAIKIGVSAALPKRLRSLASGSHLTLRLLGTVPGGPELESEFHRRFAHLQIRREWFRPAPELFAFITETAKAR